MQALLDSNEAVKYNKFPFGATIILQFSVSHLTPVVEYIVCVPSAVEIFIMIIDWDTMLLMIRD